MNNTGISYNALCLYVMMVLILCVVLRRILFPPSLFVIYYSSISHFIAFVLLLLLLRSFLWVFPSNSLPSIVTLFFSLLLAPFVPLFICLFSVSMLFSVKVNLCAHQTKNSQNSVRDKIHASLFFFRSLSPHQYVHRAYLSRYIISV